MRPITIQNDQDLWQAVQALRNGFAPGTRFRGWPVMRIRSTTPIDGITSAVQLLKVQEGVRRLYGLLRYGTRNQRRLTALDKARTKLIVHHQSDNRGIDIDFTGAMNACVEAVESWGENGPYDRPRQRSIFATPPEEESGTKKESWERTAREYFARLPRGDLKTVGICAIFAAAVAWTSVVYIKEKSKEAVKLAEAHYTYQAKLAELERTTVMAKTDRARAATPQEVATVERDLDDDTRRVMALTDEIEHPVLRFVMNEVEETMPALMDMAPTLHNATYSVNGFELRGRAAVAVGKSMRKQQKAAKKRVDTLNGWKPEITTDGWEPQVKKTTSVTS